MFLMKDLPPIGDRYTCEARVLMNENENVTTIYGAHQSGKGNIDVQGIQIFGQNLSFFPTNMDAFFPNLVAIYLSNNSISTVSNSHLIPFTNLQILTFHINRISMLDSNLFAGMTWPSTNLYISFYSNDIKHIGHDINLPNFGTIDFEKNPCISQRANNATDEIATLKLNLLRYCPPTISQIEETLESRTNLLTQLKIRNTELETRVAFIEALIGNKLGLNIDEAMNKS